MKAELGTFPKDRQILGKVLPLDTPLTVDIHVSHYCNIRCNYCILSVPEKERPDSFIRKGMMSEDTFRRIVRQLKEFPRKLKSVTISGVGEPTTHEKLPEMIRELHDAEVTDRIQLITNALLLTPELSRKLVDAGLSELRVSLQGMRAETYQKISGVRMDWQAFYDNLMYFSMIRGNCKLKIKIVDSALEPGEEDRFFAQFGDMADAVSIEHIRNLWDVNGTKLRYNQKETDKTMYGLPLIDNKICRFPFTSISIFPDGQCAEWCCYTCFGHEKNIHQVSLAQQWNSPEWNEFRYKMLKGRDQFARCRSCPVVNQTYHPEDLLMGFEDEIRARMQEKFGKSTGDQT